MTTLERETAKLKEGRGGDVATVVRVVDRYGWICHAYVVMHNHFHLLVETPLPNLRWGCGS